MCITLTFVHDNHLGSVSVTANISGTKVSEVRYYPFGEMRYSSGDTTTLKRYTSQEEQIGIGLYDYGARFYDPTIGRFVSADIIVQGPSDPQALNRYAYARGNPLKYNDPSGHFVLALVGGIAAIGVVAYVGYTYYMAPDASQRRAQAAQDLYNLSVSVDHEVTRLHVQMAVELAKAANAQNAANQSISAAGNTGSPTGPNDPNGNKHEYNFRQKYVERGYEQPFGDNDQSIARSLGIKGRTADHIFWDRGTNSYIVAESKAGSDVGGAITQLDNTSRGLFNSNWGANANNTSLIFNTNQETYMGLLRNQSGSSMYGGYSIQNGCLSYWNEEVEQWVDVLVNSLRIAVTVSP